MIYLFRFSTIGLFFYRSLVLFQFRLVGNSWESFGWSKHSHDKLTKQQRNDSASPCLLQWSWSSCGIPSFARCYSRKVSTLVDVFDRTETITENCSHKGCPKVVQFAIVTLEKRRDRKSSQNASRNCFWERYKGRAAQLLANFSPVPSNSPRSLCECKLVPVSLSVLKWRFGDTFWNKRGNWEQFLK